MLNCKQASQLISKGLDRKLTLRERFALQMHLLICKYCKRFSQQVAKLHVVINSIGKQIEEDESIRLPSERKAKILQSLGDKE